MARTAAHKWDEEGWVTTRGLVMRGCTCGAVFEAHKWQHNARQQIQADMRQHKADAKAEAALYAKRGCQCMTEDDSYGNEVVVQHATTCPERIPERTRPLS